MQDIDPSMKFKIVIGGQTGVDHAGFEAVSP